MTTKENKNAEKKTTSKKSSKKNSEKKENSWKKVLNLVGDKVLELGLNVLEKGVKEYAIQKIDDTEDEIKKVLDQKFKEYKNRIIKFGSLFVGLAFLSYGILEVILMNWNLEKYTNLFFGLIFLLVVVFVRK